MLFLELIEEPIIHNWDLANIYVLELLTVLNDAVDAKLTHSLTLAKFNVLHVGEGFHELGNNCITHGRARDFEGMAVG